MLLSIKHIHLQFKHVRFKHSFLESSNNKPYYNKVVQLYTQKVSEIFGCSPATARLLLNKNKKIVNLDSANFIANTKFCKEHFKLSDIIEFPIIITLKTNLLQHRFFSLCELGCLNISARDILNFPQHMNKTSSQLKKQGTILSMMEHIDCYRNFILCSENKKGDIISKVEKMYSDNTSLSNIKKIMNAEFLSEKLDCSLDTVHQVFKTYPSLRFQSISSMDLLIDVLTKKLGFSTEKILRNPFLLTLHHEDLESHLSSTPEILGMELRFMAVKLPAILKKSPEDVQKIGDILNDFDISLEQLMSCPKILLLSPNVLFERLNKLRASQDFGLLKAYRKFLWLAYYYNNLHKRLKDLETCGVPYSLNLFTVSKSRFDKCLTTKEYKCNFKDSCFYLSQVFGCSENEVLLKLREYPYPMNTSIQNTSKVISFLSNSGVSRKQLWNGLCIVFYEEENVRNYFMNLKYFPEFQPFSDWVEHYNLIQLLIYTMEVDAGFGGERLFKSSNRMEEPEMMNAIYSAF